MEPSDRADAQRLNQILDLIDGFERDFQGMTREAFIASPVHQDAAAHRLMHIGEKTIHLSPALHERHPDIPWRDMKGFRHIAAHAYERISAEVVWDAITTRLAPVRDMAKAELALQGERASPERDGPAR